MQGHIQELTRLFQSTLPRGERLLSCCLVSLRFYHFNPRSREGSDDKDAGTEHGRRISIHAPARGATEDMAEKLGISENFNPRSREGSDRYHHLPNTLLANFNPRSREGSDYCRHHFQRLLLDFNPRSREGSDHWQPPES